MIGRARRSIRLEGRAARPSPLGGRRRPLRTRPPPSLPPDPTLPLPGGRDPVRAVGSFADAPGGPGAPGSFGGTSGAHGSLGTHGATGEEQGGGQPGTANHSPERPGPHRSPRAPTRRRTSGTPATLA